MANIVLYKDTANILQDFAKDLSSNLKLNINARRSRFRYRNKFGNKGYVANSTKQYRSGYKPYRASGELSRSITYRMYGFTIVLEFNEYGVMLDRGTDGFVLKQRSKDSLLYDADINYNSQNTFRKQIKKWIKDRRIRPRSRSLLGIGKALPDNKTTRAQMEYLIARSIANRGQNATYWFSAPYKALSKKLPENLIFGMIKNVDDTIDNIFK